MGHLLIVEDESDIRAIWEETLVSAGHAVETAEDGVQAIKLIGTQLYDAVLFDLKLPRLGGLEAIKLIRRTEPDLPILAVTGQQDPDLARAALDAGANDIVFKPVPLDELAQRLTRYVEQRNNPN